MTIFMDPQDYANAFQSALPDFHVKCLRSESAALIAALLTPGANAEGVSADEWVWDEVRKAFPTGFARDAIDGGLIQYDQEAGF